MPGRYRVAVDESTALPAEFGARQPGARTRGAVVSTSLAVLAFVSGDAAMVAVCAATRALLGSSWVLEWLAASVVIAAGAFLVFGLPQLLAWRTGDSSVRGTPDARTLWAARLLRSGGILVFLVASLTGGPLAIAWFFGRRQHPRALLLTAISAALLAVAWSAVYLGLLRLW